MVCGLFLPVWDNEAKTKGLDYDRLLRMTKGGPPHVTVFYSGDMFDRDELTAMVQTSGILKHLVDRELEVTGVYPNTFFEASTQSMRTDVLLDLSHDSKKLIEGLRSTLVEYMAPDKIEKLGMVAPHITHTVTYDATFAASICEAVSQQFAAGGVKVTITGVNFA